MKTISHLRVTTFFRRVGTRCFSFRNAAWKARTHSLSPMEIFKNSKVPSAITRVIDEIMKGMALGLTPQLAFDGTAGTYEMRDQNRSTVAIFKPIDEEAFAPNNPRGYVGEFGQTTFRNGVLSGEGVIREVASYMMDHGHYA